ncbi:hypothetical protein ACXVUM_08120 [Williamsia sp. SKLECPSW1]
MTTSETSNTTAASDDVGDEVEESTPTCGEVDQDEKSVEVNSSRPTRHRWAAVLALLVVLILITGGLATYFGLQVVHDDEVRTAQTQAESAAKSFALTMVSYDAAGMDSYVQKVMAGSTGELKETFSRTSNGLKDTLVKAGVKSTGRVLDVATRSAARRHVDLVVVVQQTASNSTVTTPQEAVNVLQMAMEKVDGRWLASSVQNPSGAAP